METFSSETSTTKLIVYVQGSQRMIGPLCDDIDVRELYIHVDHELIRTQVGNRTVSTNV